MESLNPEIYRKAAEAILDANVSLSDPRATDRSYFSCSMIIWVSRKPNSPELQAFEDTFLPYENCEKYTSWFGSFEKPENQLARQLALLLMAEMVESEAQNGKN